MNGTKKVLLGGRIFLESGEAENNGVVLEDGSIIKLMPEPDTTAADAEKIDCSGKLIAPGLIDTHVHGACGRNYMEGSAEAMSVISDFLIKGGTTSCLATTTSAPQEYVECALRGIVLASRRPVKGQVELLGIHLEGPFINPQKRGSHAEAAIRGASRQEIERIAETAGKSLKIVTIAPETDYAMETVQFFADMGVGVSVGHTEADFELTQTALRAGASRATHLFNAMPPLHHREPGAAAALLLDPSVFLEITADGHHIAPAVLNMVLKLAGPERCILITDGMDARGCGDGIFQRWEGTTVTIKDGQAKTQKGGLAGSLLSMSDAVRNIVRLTGVPVSTAIRMASENPARSVGVFDRKGSISEGKDADFVIFNADLSVYMTIVRGDIVYKGE